jgi:hypothetical protein
MQAVKYSLSIAAVRDARMTTIEKLTMVLADGNWHSAEELVKEVDHRFSATIHVAKQRGYQVDKRRISKNLFEYRRAN